MSILNIKLKTNFARYECLVECMSKQLLDQVAHLPSVGNLCQVRLHPEAKSSAFSQMWEPAILGGYIESEQGLKALVIFTEREDADGDEDFEFVPVAVLRPFKPQRDRVFTLTWR